MLSRNRACICTQEDYHFKESKLMINERDMVIDAFPGFNEVELAEFRITYLKDVVDKVIIAESELTHSG